MESPVLAEVVRSGFVEAVHRGSVVAVDPDGSVAWSVGEVHAPMSPRSANKPMQAAGMVECGLSLAPEQLALVAASHSGEDFHAEGVLAILGGAGLSEDHLRCPPSWPVDDVTRLGQQRSGGQETRVRMNCSGKHAGMLATCVARGWPTDSYLDPAHPLQLALRDTVGQLAGEESTHTGVDGCGAPLFALSLVGLARAFGRVGCAADGSAPRRVADAIRAHPRSTSGTRRDEAALIEGVPGLLAKSGAEGCYAVTLPDGRAVALKIDDGGQRARPVVMAAALWVMGLREPVVEAQLREPVLGGGQVVGEVRPVPLARAGRAG